MPPAPATNTATQAGASSTTQSRQSTLAVARVHPILTSCLINSARMTQPLLLLSLLFNSKLTRRPPRQRVLIWYLAYFSFYSRHLLALLSLRVLFTGGGRRAGNGEVDAEGVR